MASSFLAMPEMTSLRFDTGNDTVTGGDDNDRFGQGGNDVSFTGDAGDDFIDGGRGHRQISPAESAMMNCRRLW